MGLPIYHVDAFTAKPFRGNPAAVVVFDDANTDERSHDARWMQSIAAEMNLAETAFVSRLDDGTWGLRWFTPTVEVRLCGHATLASAHVLASTGRATSNIPIEFTTQVSGRLVARQLATVDHSSRIEISLPALRAPTAPLPELVANALGVSTAVFGGYNPLEYWLIVLESHGALQALRPDFSLLRDRDESYAVTAPSDDPAFDFVSRYFAPGHGIDEDPVTGSAHCVYAPYWTERLGKSIVVGQQISARTGVVECEPVGDRVLLRGDAVTVFAGTLAI